MREADAEQVLAIYQAGLDTGQASFETVAPELGGLHRRQAAAPALRRHRHRDRRGRRLGRGLARSRPGRSTPGSSSTASTSTPAARRTASAARCWPRSSPPTEDAGVWTIQSGIFPENAASLSLHQALGFRVVGTRERVGRHHGVWRDVILLERRSTVAGC